MKNPATGKYNQNIQIMKIGNVSDAAGGTVPGHVLYWATAASAELLKSARSLQANQEALKPSARFVVQYREDKFLDENMIIKWRGQVFNILTADPDFVTKKTITITATSSALPKR